MQPSPNPSATAIAPFVGGFPALFDAYGQALADHVAQAFPPQYRLQLSGAASERLRHLGRAPFPAQAHAAAAVAAHLEAHRSALVVGEASVGKTQIALTTAALVGARRILVVAASNLLAPSQWPAEIRAVLPQARIYDTPSSIGAIERILTEMRDCTGPCVLLLSRDQVKLGSPWRPAAVPILGPAAADPAATQAQPSRPTRTALYCPACKSFLRRALVWNADPQVREFKTVPLHKIPPGIVAYCPDCRRGATDVAVDTRGEDDDPGSLPTWYTCCRCRSVLATAHMTVKENPLTHLKVRLPESIEPWSRGYLEAARRSCSRCGEAAWTYVRTPHGRAASSIARYLARRHARFFDLLIADEVQDYKEAGTAQGMMLTHLLRASRRAVAQTATLAGGKPSTMFYLLHRLLPEFRRAWPYSACTRFARAYGLAETLARTRTYKVPDKSGKLTLRKQTERTSRELPGINPLILRHVLDSAVFLTLRDLGVAMPPYSEEAVELPMLPEQAHAYNDLVKELLPHIKQGLRYRQLKRIGAALQALLTYPSTPWRGESVVNPRTGQIVAAAPALDPALQYPMEAEFIRRCRAEASEGRRVLVYVTHTDRRDITPRLAELLEGAQLRAAVLRRDTVSSRRRAEWVRQQAGSVDVLITHPKLVGTGLNIPEFHTVIWYEPELSAYTLRQASRRTWRIGQEKEVRVYFLIYKDTAQQAALALASRKILASLLVEGQVDSDHAIATYDAGGEIFYELAKAVIERTNVADVHDTLRQISEAHTRANELCDATLTPQAPPGVASVIPLAPRHRQVAITRPVLAEQTELFAIA